MKAPKFIRNMTLRTRRALVGYLFISPFFIGFLLFMAGPLLDSLRMSFSNVVTKGFTMTWKGLDNYIYALTIDPKFNRNLTDQVSTMIVNTLATLVLSFVVAVLLNKKFHGRTLARAIFFLPVIFSAGVLLGLDKNMITTTSDNLVSAMSAAMNEEGSVNMTETLKTLLQTTGVATEAFQVVFNIIDSVYDVVIASGIQIIVFLSGMQSISVSLYEAADVEGCSAWEAFWMITFPMVSPLLLVNAVYTIIDFFTKSNNVVIEQISQTMYSYNDFGLASAMSWIYFAIAAAMMGVAALIIRAGVKSYE